VRNPANLRATLRIALVVGFVLTGINEGDTLASGRLGVGLAVKIPLDFVVPFLVSNRGAPGRGDPPVTGRRGLRRGRHVVGPGIR